MDFGAAHHPRSEGSGFGAATGPNLLLQVDRGTETGKLVGLPLGYQFAAILAMEKLQNLGDRRPGRTKAGRVVASTDVQRHFAWGQLLAGRGQVSSRFLAGF